ncbi:MAG: sugar ABC transporter permease [Spirochaetaceae bacterium]|nr:sugar ABC transporter permease [Spirochaetaceae bacterium]
MLAGAVLVPTLALVVLFGHIPALSSLRLAFSRYNIKQPARRGFVGLDNFVHVLTDDAFHAALGRVAYFMATAIVAVLAIGLVFALVLNRDFRGRALLRTVIIIPWAIPPVVSGHAWRWIFNGEYGALNGLLWQAGVIGEYRFWLTEPLTALSAAVLVFVWRFVPFVAVLFLGALQTIPAELYESAAVDGAGPVRRFRHVTVPAVTAIAAIALVLTGITAFNVFDEIYALTGPQEITRTPMIYNYETTFVRGRFGRGAAMAYLSGLVLFALSIVYMRLALRERDV